MERTRPLAELWLSGPVLAVVLGSLLIPTAARAATSSTKQVTTNWQAFFKGTTPAAEKIRLLQNGSSFAAIIDGQANSPLGKSTTAKVLSVKLTSSTKASVKYTIYLSGKAALSDQTGTAVYQSKTWKVEDASFCALLSLEGTKPAACPKQ